MMLNMLGYKDSWTLIFCKGHLSSCITADELVVFEVLLLICSPTLTNYLQIPFMFLSAENIV